MPELTKEQEQLERRPPFTIGHQVLIIVTANAMNKVDPEQTIQEVDRLISLSQETERARAVEEAMSKIVEAINQLMPGKFMETVGSIRFGKNIYEGKLQPSRDINGDKTL